MTLTLPTQDIEAFTDMILDEYPCCPVAEARAIATYTISKGFFYHGLVPEQPVKAAVISFVRHTFTDYDERVNALNRSNNLASNKNEARYYVSDEVSAKMREWQPKNVRTKTEFYKGR